MAVPFTSAGSRNLISLFSRPPGKLLDVIEIVLFLTAPFFSVIESFIVACNELIIVSSRDLFII